MPSFSSLKASVVLFRTTLPPELQMANIFSSLKASQISFPQRCRPCPRQRSPQSNHSLVVHRLALFPSCTYPCLKLSLLFTFLDVFNPHPRICLLILEREEGRERNINVNIDRLPPIHSLTGDQTRNHNLFSVWNGAPTHWAIGPGL